MSTYRKLHSDDTELNRYKYWTLKNLRLLLNELRYGHGGVSLRDLRFMDYIEEIISINGVSKDGCVRPETSLESMAKLKPAFDKEFIPLEAIPFFFNMSSLCPAFIVEYILYCVLACLPCRPT